MPSNEAVNLSVRWDLLKAPEGATLLTLHGELTAVSTPAAWIALEKELAGAGVTSLEIDASHLDYCDSAGLSLLYYLYTGRMTPGATVRMSGLTPEMQNIFGSFSMEDFQTLQAHEPPCRPLPEEVGAETWRWLCDLREQIEFIGEVALNLAAGLLRPRRMRWKEVFRVFETAGVNALPIVALITLLVGMVIAFESAKELEKLGAQMFVANLLGVAMSRDLGPVMAAIMLAARSGSAFAAELGTMKVNEELNALKTMGLSPIQFLVVQRVMAGILLTPILTIYAMYSGLLGGVPVLLGLGFPLRMVLQQIRDGVHCGDIAEGLCKSVVFGTIVASMSCLRGLQTGVGPRAVGDSTTRSVVSSILLIILADGLIAAITYRLRQ
jgi:phospholipid/cholesterol/gamma-HCH transport system permease protein